MPVPHDAPARGRMLARDTAYDALRAAILDGTLAPGERLRDPELCAWLGLSRTPVREALARLEEDGLVETKPQSSTRVTPLDRRQARDAAELAAAVHALAAELGVPRLAPAGVAAMRAANDRLAAALAAEDVAGAIAADDAFHGVLVACCGNAEVARVLDRLTPRLRRVERLRFGSLRGRRSVAEHAEIARLAAAGDAEGAARAVRANWLSLGGLIDRAFDPQETS